SLIRSEPPRTVCRESGRCPSHGRPEVSPAVASSADCPTHAIPFLGPLFLGHAVLHATREVPDESEELAADCRDDLLLALPPRGHLPVAAMQPLLSRPRDLDGSLVRVLLPFAQCADNPRSMSIVPGGLDDYAPEMRVS